MEIKLNTQDLDYIAKKVEDAVSHKIMMSIASSAGYELMSEQDKKWVNMHTDEGMVQHVINQRLDEIVKNQMAAMFNQYATPDKKAIVAPIREAIRAAALEQVAEMARRINLPDGED